MERIGTIERIEDGVAWGRLQEMTIDLPAIIDAVNGFFEIQIGHEVTWIELDKGDACHLLVIVRNNNQCVAMHLDDTDEGFEIGPAEIFTITH